MGTTTIISLTSGFIGAIIGALGSILTIFIQERHKSRRERSRLAVELAIKDYDFSLEHAKSTPGKVKIFPLTSYVLYHAKLLERLEKVNLTPEDLRQVFEDHDKIDKIIEECQRDKKFTRQSTPMDNSQPPSI